MDTILSIMLGIPIFLFLLLLCVLAYIAGYNKGKEDKLRDVNECLDELEKLLKDEEW